MKRYIDCPAGRTAPTVEEEQRQLAYDWYCTHQLQLQLVAYTDTIDERTRRLTEFQNAMFAAAYLRKE